MIRRFNFPEKLGGTWFYWNSVSHHMELIKKYRFYFTKYIKKNSKVLDLGAGRLFYRKELLKFSKNYSSIDFQRTHPDLDYIGTASKTGLDSNSFDLVFCSQVLEHVPDPEASFKEINRILKKGGVAIISVPFLMYLHNEPYDYYRYTKHALKKFAEDSKFKIITIEEVGGLFGFVGAIFNQLNITFLGRYNITFPLFYAINYILQLLFFCLDKIIPNKKLFPSNYLLIIKK